MRKLTIQECKPFFEYFLPQILNVGFLEPLREFGKNHPSSVGNAVLSWHAEIDALQNNPSSTFICEGCFQRDFGKLIQRAKLEEASEVILDQEGEEFFHQKFLAVKLIHIIELIDLLQDLHQKQPDKGYDRKALEIFERKQGRVFLEEMGQSGARLFAGLPEDISQKERDLKTQLEQTRKRLVDERSKRSTEQNKESVEDLEQRENTLQAEQTALQEQIKTDYPDYYALKYPQPASLSELQEQV